MTLFSDAAVGILTQGFIDSTINVGGNWNLETTLPNVFSEDLGVYSADTFSIELLEKLIKAYPKNQFAQYTTAFDIVQIQFLKIMAKIDEGSTDPNEWALTNEDGALFGFWNFQAENSFASLATNTGNYQFYLGAGSIHTVLTDAFATELVPHPFYNENSAGGGIFFSDWIDRFVNTKSFNQENLKYSD